MSWNEFVRRTEAALEGPPSECWLVFGLLFPFNALLTGLWWLSGEPLRSTPSPAFHDWGVVVTVAFLHLPAAAAAVFFAFVSERLPMRLELRWRPVRLLRLLVNCTMIAGSVVYWIYLPLDGA